MWASRCASQGSSRAADRSSAWSTLLLKYGDRPLCRLGASLSGPTAVSTIPPASTNTACRRRRPAAYCCELWCWCWLHCWCSRCSWHVAGHHVSGCLCRCSCWQCGRSRRTLPLLQHVTRCLVASLPCNPHASWAAELDSRNVKVPMKHDAQTWRHGAVVNGVLHGKNGLACTHASLKHARLTSNHGPENMTGHAGCALSMH